MYLLRRATDFPVIPNLREGLHGTVTYRTREHDFIIQPGFPGRNGVLGVDAQAGNGIARRRAIALFYGATLLRKVIRACTPEFRSEFRSETFKVGIGIASKPGPDSRFKSRNGSRVTLGQQFFRREGLAAHCTFQRLTT